MLACSGARALEVRTAVGHDGPTPSTAEVIGEAKFARMPDFGQFDFILFLFCFCFRPGKPELNPKPRTLHPISDGPFRWTPLR